MAVSLVGTIGVVSQGASGAAVTPAYGTSENRVVGNLLVLWVGVTGIATLPATPAGWTLLKSQAGTSCSASIFYKIAAGADAQPTIALIASGTIAAQLGEFTGQAAGPILSTTGGAASAVTTPLVLTNGSIDIITGSLFVESFAAFYSAAATKTFSHVFNNGTMTTTDNSATATAAHYSFGYSVTTAASVADSDSFSWTVTSATGAAGAVGAFNSPRARPKQMVVGQATQRAGSR